MYGYTVTLLLVFAHAAHSTLYYDLDQLLKRFPLYDDDVMNDRSLDIALREPGHAVLRDEESLQHAQIGDGFQYISGEWPRYHICLRNSKDLIHVYNFVTFR